MVSVKNQIYQINEKSNLIDVAMLDNKLGYIFADAANDLIKKVDINPNQVAAIGSHGQTILHAPTIAEKTSIQISDPKFRYYQAFRQNPNLANYKIELMHSQFFAHTDHQSGLLDNPSPLAAFG